MCVCVCLIRNIFLDEEVALMYVAALKKQPKNEELMTRLFMAHVSNDDYQKQKQVTTVMLLSTSRVMRLYLGSIGTTQTVSEQQPVLFLGSNECCYAGTDYILESKYVNIIQFVKLKMGNLLL